MQCFRTNLSGVLLIEPQVFGDSRGFFMETWNSKRYAELGIPEHFVQDNASYSARGVLRGLHFQNPNGQGKLVSVMEGSVFDVAVDIRRDSPQFGQWASAVLSAENKKQLYIPPGFAHGFLVTSDFALFMYKCTDLYNQASEGCVAWDDPDIGIQWPDVTPILSSKDVAAPRLKDIPRDRLPALK
jgi:dTDP-4-dehydrorhamnose 3,5-epimerase